MKHQTILSILCAASLLGGGSFAYSKPPGGGGPDAFEPGRPPGKRMHNIMRDLSPDEAQRLRAALEKAKSDPTIRSLKEQRDALDAQLEKSMNAAILAADPTLAPVLDKINNARSRAKEVRKEFESLTPEQKAAIKAARQGAKDDPAVVAAREKVKAATTPEARRQAEQEMHAAHKAAIIKQNPALAPLLEKLGPPPGARKGNPPPPHDDEEEEN